MHLSYYNFLGYDGESSEKLKLQMLEKDLESGINLNHLKTNRNDVTSSFDYSLRKLKFKANS